MEQLGQCESGAKPVFKIDKDRQMINYSRVSWNKDQESHLLALVQINNGKNWKKISFEMQRLFNNPELTAKKCRERWCNCTNPELDKTSLNDAEELFLLVYHFDYKNKWALISQHLPNRNSSKLKNNFSSLVRKFCRKISIGDNDVLVSIFSYIQAVYAVVLIYDLILLTDNTEAVSTLAPVHIYEHIKSKFISEEMCLRYLMGMTSNLINRYKTRVGLQKLALIGRMEQYKNFLSKAIASIKARLSPTNPITDESLLYTIELSLSETAPLMLPIPSPMSTSPMLLPPLPKISETSTMTYQLQPMMKQPETEALQIPELRIQMAYPHSMTPVNLSSTELNLPIPTFASPAFQASLQSCQSRAATPSPSIMLSSSCYPPLLSSMPMPMFRSPNEYLFIAPMQMQPMMMDTMAKPKPPKASDFTMFTNKYVK